MSPAMLVKVWAHLVSPHDRPENTEMNSSSHIACQQTNNNLIMTIGNVHPYFLLYTQGKIFLFCYKRDIYVRMYTL